MDGIPKGAPALFVAHQYSARASKVGFDWPDVSGIEAKAAEEYAEILAAETDAKSRVLEIGDLIFVLVNWLRWLGVDDPESLVRAKQMPNSIAASSMSKRVRTRRAASLADFSLDELEAFWLDAKQLYS